MYGPIGEKSARVLFGLRPQTKFVRQDKADKFLETCRRAADKKFGGERRGGPAAQEIELGCASFLLFMECETGEKVHPVALNSRHAGPVLHKPSSTVGTVPEGEAPPGVAPRLIDLNRTQESLVVPCEQPAPAPFMHLRLAGSFSG